MKSRILQIALRIALIKEEFSEQEILEAVNLLQSQGITSQLLSYLSDNKPVRANTKIASKNRKNTKIQKTQVPKDIENEEPEKYKLLTEFEDSLRKSHVLADSTEIRRLGERLNKEFSAKNSRTDLINNLIKFLVSMSTNDIKNIINDISSSYNKNDEYQQLANFIIEGQPREK